jgi:hypothetical protein
MSVQTVGRSNHGDLDVVGDTVLKISSRKSVRV